MEKIQGEATYIKPQELKDRMTGLRYFVDVPYQRGDVWDKRQQRYLIETMLAQLPINNIWMALSNIPGRENCIDGKQRINAIKAFLNNDLKVQIEVNNKKQMCTYEQLKELDITAFNLFNDYRIPLVLIQNKKTLELQAQVMKRINNSKPFSQEEKSYTTNFLLKLLLHHISEHGDFKALFTHIGGRKANNKRYKTYRFIHELLYVCCGEFFNINIDLNRIKLIAGNKLEKNAQDLHSFFSDQLMEMAVNEQDLVNPLEVPKIMTDLQQHAEIDENIKAFLFCCRHVADLLDHSNYKLESASNLNSIHSSTLLYLFPFIFEQIKRTVLTEKYLKANADKLGKFGLDFIKYSQDAAHNQRVNKRIKDRNYFNGSLKALKNCFVSAGIDTSIKGMPDCPGVYVMKVKDNCIKIGKSDSSIKARAQAANTWGGSIIGVLSFDPNDESKFHSYFEKFRSPGPAKEIFNLTDDCKQLLKDHEFWGCGF